MPAFTNESTETGVAALCYTRAEGEGGRRREKWIWKVESLLDLPLHIFIHEALILFKTSYLLLTREHTLSSVIALMGILSDYTLMG